MFVLLLAAALASSPAAAQQAPGYGMGVGSQEATIWKPARLGSLQFIEPAQLPELQWNQAAGSARPQAAEWLVSPWPAANLQPTPAIDARIESQVSWQNQPAASLPPLADRDPPPSPPSESDAGEESIAEAESLGEEPEDRSLVFLRRETVLLNAGECQVDVGLTYSLTENAFPVALTDDQGQVEAVVGARLRRRLLIIPFEVRYGLTDRTQLFLSAPVGWAGTELAFPEFDEFANVGGVADINLGASFLLKRSCGYDAEIIGTVAMTFPTGNDAFPIFGFTPDSQLGEGFFALSASLLFIHTFDPVVVFYGGGFRHRFDDTFLDNEVDPGEQFLYQLGVGFAVNEFITLSSSLLGLYVTENEINGQRVEGSILEPIRLRFSATISNDLTLAGWRRCETRRAIIEPFAEIGMTRDAPSARFGITWTF